MLIREGNGTPLQYSCLENPTDGGAWWAAIHGVAKGRTQLSDFTFTFHFHALEKEMATHSSVLAWRIPGTGEPGGLLSMAQSWTRQKWLSSSSSIPQCNYKNKKEKEVKIEAFFSPLFQIECNYYMTDMEAQWYLGLSLLQSSCSKIHNMQLSSYGLKIAVPSHSVISVW